MLENEAFFSWFELAILFDSGKPEYTILWGCCYQQQPHCFGAKACGGAIACHRNELSPQGWDAEK
jgi:hypothetical protein